MSFRSSQLDDLDGFFCHLSFSLKKVGKKITTVFKNLINSKPTSRELFDPCFHSARGPGGLFLSLFDE